MFYTPCYNQYGLLSRVLIRRKIKNFLKMCGIFVNFELFIKKRTTMENEMRKLIDQVKNFGKSLNENKDDGINYSSIDLGNETERKIDDIIQAVYWSGGDIDKVYDEWKDLNLHGIEYNNKSIHFLNWLKSKFPKFSNIEKPTSNKSDTVKEINKLLQLIKDIQGSSEVSRLYDEYENIERPTIKNIKNKHENFQRNKR